VDYIKTVLDCPVVVDGIYTVHYFEYAKDFAYSGEVHDFWELVYADKKNLFITAGAKEIELEAGQMYLHKPNEFHNIRCDGKRAANSIIISFDCSTPELMNVAGRVITLGENERRLIGSVVKEASASFATPLGNPYTNVMELSQAGGFGTQQMIRLSVEMLLIRLIRKNINEGPVKIKKNNALLAQIIDFLTENVEKKLTFEDILKHFNLSASVVKKIFREQMGCGIMDYFVRLKVDKAKELIREENYTFTEIAESLGFSTSQYFTTVFKRVSGMTPSEYARKAVRFS
jgi:AraC-like DNA-binding protein